MKENLKKIKIVLLLCILLLNFGCSAQTHQKKDFYNYIEKIIGEKEFAFFEISLIKKCNNQYLFGFAKMNYNDNLSNRIKTYNYKGSLIIFDLGEEKDKQIINFFDSFFEKTNQDISNLKKGRQSTIDERALYFVDKKFIPDFNRTQIFMESDCDKSE
ncbi:hypothetical protein C1637_19130 [Chryseobacterium lactis]|uniref:Lipoprotein n=1 Tax=Chryseobacterium lactis TaxID=1241981 RepID=A0A3G6RTJ6_CHRLC|nr:hypothetical protein [Chryseobacterium lactis]AZA84896.1 hypothetical protein EG342_24640 [Chryseobacterium lactis]AZB05284.1 hypothetical protein EG341_15520 [Chryseobacterium lactis]PNW12267.1 hypothetical protein C1637_19130 [Chryseobacterium lactis]